MARVKQIFDSRGWPGKRLAEYFGVSRSHICHILHGRARPKVLQKAMARLLEMDDERLWGEWHYSHTSPLAPGDRRRRRPRP